MKKFKQFILEQIDIEYYKHGQCELFAYALHKILNYDMYFFVDNEAEFDDEYELALIHAYCRDKNGNYFDANGLVTLDDIENEHTDYVNDPEHILVDDSMFFEYIQSGFISNFKQSELNILEKYIKDNISIFIK